VRPGDALHLLLLVVPLLRRQHLPQFLRSRCCCCRQLPPGRHLLLVPRLCCIRVQGGGWGAQQGAHASKHGAPAQPLLHPGQAEQQAGALGVVVAVGRLWGRADNRNRWGVMYAGWDVMGVGNHLEATALPAACASLAKLSAGLQCGAIQAAAGDYSSTTSTVMYR
jgi:hypothetical protein